jgi:aminopeptidase N
MNQLPLRINKRTHIICMFILCLFASFAQAQTERFIRQDSLRGTLNPYRACYDVTFYNLNLRIDPDQQSIRGFNEIHFTATADFSQLQIDLFANMNIEKIVFKDQNLQYTREGDAVFVKMPGLMPKNSQGMISVFYDGRPVTAVNPPWDGGFVWRKDENNRHWVGVACEGIGASLWWPNKDHLSEEPDSMAINIEVPAHLMAVCNGQLRNTTTLDNGKIKRYEWFVSYPINNYNVTVNIADYVSFTDSYTAGDGEKISLSYYVLRYNLDKAKPHFKQVKPMLAAYEKLFGKYPFARDGYALVETSYWGMEHQSAIAYGNNYKNNEWGFDFIIIHESGHEYWGNSLTCTDHAEMWIHESFCTYAEALYVEQMKDYKTAVKYLLSQRGKIKNNQPILGPLGVNYQGWDDADMYYKGSWMLHTLRNVVRNDSLWLSTIHGLATDFKLSHVTTEEVIGYISQKLGADYSWFFRQYLYQAAMPKLEYRLSSSQEGTTVHYRWNAGEKDFRMPVKIAAPGGDWQWVTPTSSWQEVLISSNRKVKQIRLDQESFYTEAVKVK